MAIDDIDDIEQPAQQDAPTRPPDAARKRRAARKPQAPQAQQPPEPPRVSEPPQSAKGGELPEPVPPPEPALEDAILEEAPEDLELPEEVEMLEPAEEPSAGAPEEPPAAAASAGEPSSDARTSDDVRNELRQYLNGVKEKLDDAPGGERSLASPSGPADLLDYLEKLSDYLPEREKQRFQEQRRTSCHGITEVEAGRKEGPAAVNSGTLPPGGSGEEGAAHPTSGRRYVLLSQGPRGVAPRQGGRLTR